MSHKKRILGLDLLKMLTLIAIATLHANEFIFFEDYFLLGKKSPFYYLMTFYARLFAIGGQILISIIFFLYGFNKKSKKDFLNSCIFCLIGQTVLFFTFDQLEWDIYTFLFFSLALISSFNFFYNYHKINIFLSLLILFLPNFYYLNFFSNDSILSFLFGTSSQNQSGSWPLLPWFFLALLFYQLGIIGNLKIEKLQILDRKELYIWFIGLGISLPFIGHYYLLPIGRNYYHFTFFQHSIYFLSNFLPFVFLGRLSLLNSTQSFLEKYRFFHLVSNSAWNQNMAASYFLSVIYLGIGINFRDYFLLSPRMFDIFFLGIFLMPEILIRTFKFVKKTIIQLYYE